MNTAFANFQVSVNRVRDVANQIDVEVGLPTMGPAVRSRHETLGCGSVVILSGFFETYLKDVVRAFVRDVCALARPFTTLPKELKRTHMLSGAQVLLNVARGRGRWITSTADQILTRLSSVLQPHPSPYDLLWEAFADTRANPGSTTIENILKGCAIKKPWEKLATHAARGRSAVALQFEIDSFIGMRNECAHTGRPTVTPTTTMLRDYADSVVDVGTGVLGALQDRLAHV